MAINTKSTVLSYCTTMGGTYVPLAGVHEFSVPKVVIEKIDVTALADSKYQYIIGLEKDDDLSFKVFHSAAVYTILTATLLNTEMWYKILFSDGSGYNFQGVLCEMDCKGNVNQSVSWDCKIFLNGGVTAVIGS